jgi:hypothetical protein
MTDGGSVADVADVADAKVLEKLTFPVCVFWGLRVKPI